MTHLKCICNTFRNANSAKCFSKGFRYGEISVRNIKLYKKNRLHKFRENYELTLFKLNSGLYCVGISQKSSCDCDWLCSAGLSQKSALCWVCPEYIQGETQRKYFIRSAKPLQLSPFPHERVVFYSIRISRLSSLSLRMSLGTLQMKPLPHTVSFLVVM